MENFIILFIISAVFDLVSHKTTPDISLYCTFLQCTISEDCTPALRTGMDIAVKPELPGMIIFINLDDECVELI